MEYLMVVFDYNDEYIDEKKAYTREELKCWFDYLYKKYNIGKYLLYKLKEEETYFKG